MKIPSYNTRNSYSKYKMLISSWYFYQTTYCRTTILILYIQSKRIPTLMAARSSLINLLTSFSTSGDSRSLFFLAVFLNRCLQTFFNGGATAVRQKTALSLHMYMSVHIYIHTRTSYVFVHNYLLDYSEIFLWIYYITYTNKIN